jgi:hypothetical protein
MHDYIKRKKYILPFKVSPLFQICIQCLKVGNVPQPRFEIFQSCTSVAEPPQMAHGPQILFLLVF